MIAAFPRPALTRHSQRGNTGRRYHDHMKEHSDPTCSTSTSVQTDYPTLLTLGHSTRSAEELISLLRDNKVDLLADVRTVPRSRHNPQFNYDTLPHTLQAAGIEYRHCKDLGGLRKARRDSINDAWRNASFRGYADYMQTPEFETALATLLALTAQHRVAIMCAEAVPWRCHRSLIADVVTARGGRVEHIIGNKTQPHQLTRFAVVDNGHVTYPYTPQS